MKTTILNRMVCATAAILLPTALVAQDLGPEGSENNSSSSAFSSGGTFSGQSQQKGGFRTGIIVEDGVAYVIHRLQSEMSLPNGSKVDPNGTITKSDGSVQDMDKGKVLSIDGRLMDGPFSEPMNKSTGNQSGTGLGTASSFVDDLGAETSSGTGPSTSLDSGTSSGSTGFESPSQPSLGVGIPESGSPFSSPAYPGRMNDTDLDSNSGPGSSGLGKPAPDPGYSNGPLSPETTD